MVGQRFYRWKLRCACRPSTIFQQAHRTFILRYNNNHGEKRRITLGSYPIFSLSEARTKARSILGRVADGEDPAAEKAASAAADTFAQLREQFLIRHASQKKPRTQAEYKRIINKHLLPA